MKICYFCKTKINPSDNGGHTFFSRYDPVYYHKNCYLWNMNMRNV